MSSPFTRTFQSVYKWNFSSRFGFNLALHCLVNCDIRERVTQCSVCVCVLRFSLLQDGPEDRQRDAAPHVSPLVGGPPPPCRGCGGSWPLCFFPAWTSVRGTGPGGLGVGFWVVSPAPAAQLPGRQPVRQRDPGGTGQLHPAFLAAAVLRHLLGRHSWTGGVCQVPPAGSAESGRPAGRVRLQRSGGGRSLLQTSSEGGGPGDPLGPPDCGGDHWDHGEGVRLTGRDEEGGEGAGDPRKVRTRSPSSSWRAQSIAG